MTLVMKQQSYHSSAENEPTTFDALFTQHYDRVYGILFRLVGNRAEAEELAQEAFLKLYQSPPTRPDSEIGAWLYRVATNIGYNALRSRKRSLLREQAVALPEADRSADPAQQLIVEESRRMVRQALGLLTPQQGQLLLLKQMGLSYKELAVACDIHPNSVGKYLSRAADAFKGAYLTVAKEHPNV